MSRLVRVQRTLRMIAGAQQAPCLTLRERATRLRDGAADLTAELLPRRVAYFAIVGAACRAADGRYPGDVTALQMLEDRR
ncbi:MAG: hypothetical protein WKF96_00215 [Solirubrobacteraceae bacterium]